MGDEAKEASVRLSRIVPILLSSVLVAGGDPLSAGAAPGGTGKANAGSDQGAYATQGIAWQRCFDELPDGMPKGSDALECGSFLAPRDWGDPDAGVDVTIAVSRLAPPGGADRSILTNPGGPGAPGRGLPVVFLRDGRTEVLAHFEVIGVDVRGTGASTNVTCLNGSGTGESLDPRDRHPENLDLMVDGARYAARICQAGGGELGDFVNTEQTVKDLDLLRALLGRERISWVGYSGGTWMGAFYATYFPERVDRFVLDANTEFTAGWQATFGNQPLGFQRRFEVDFLPYVARYDDYFGLGASAAEVEAVYESLRASLAAEPLDLGDGVTVYSVTVDHTMAGAMYSKGSFQGAAEFLRSLRDLAAGRHDGMAAARDRRIVAAHVARARRLERFGGAFPVAPDAFSATFLHITCNDTPWEGDAGTLVSESETVGGRYPLVGWYHLSNPCVFWDRPAVTLPEPTGAGLPPVLMVQTERDPATPYEGAKRASEAFRAARLLTVTDEGDHGSYALGNECVGQAVDAFLLDGVLPAPTCPGEPIPAPNPVDDPVSLLGLLEDIATGGTVAELAAELAAELTAELGRLAGLRP